MHYLAQIDKVRKLFRGFENLCMNSEIDVINRKWTKRVDE